MILVLPVVFETERLQLEQQQLQQQRQVGVCVHQATAEKAETQEVFQAWKQVYWQLTWAEKLVQYDQKDVLYITSTLSNLIDALFPT